MAHHKLIKTVVITFVMFFSYYLLCPNALAQDEAPSDFTVSTTISDPNLKEVVSQRDKNTRVWEIVGSTRRIIEKGCGICYQDPNGLWQITDSSWRQTEDGFVVDKANYSLRIGKTVDSVMTYNVNGRELDVKPFALKADNGNDVVLIATIDNTIQGKIVADCPNKLIFTNAFGAGIDIEIEAKPDGYHQNIIFREKPVLLTGFDISSTTIKLCTEMDLDKYDSLTSANVILEIGSLIETATDNDPSADPNLSTPTTSSWDMPETIAVTDLSETTTTRDNIRFVECYSDGTKITRHTLVRSEVFAKIDEQENTKYRNIATAEKQFIRDAVTNETYLVESIDAEIVYSSSEVIIWDYHIISSTLETQTWQSGHTYYISSGVSIGTDCTLTIEPGTVVKFNPGSLSYGEGDLIARGSPSRPIIFTSKHDDSFGEIIDGSTGLPEPEDYTGIYLDDDCVFEYCNVFYARTGINISNYDSTPSLVIQNNYFASCNVAIESRRYTDVPYGHLRILNNLISSSPPGIRDENPVYLQYGIFLNDPCGMFPSPMVYLANNTIDGYNVGITVFSGTTQVEVLVVNCLFTHCNIGIRGPSAGGVGSDYNAFQLVNKKQKEYDGSVSTSSPPTDITLNMKDILYFEDTYYIDQDSDVIDEGLDWTEILYLLDGTFTTDFADNDADESPVDIGFHYSTMSPTSAATWLVGYGIVDDSLEAHWKFDETTGNTAADSSDNGNDGTLVNGPTWQIVGKIKGALEFDGGDEYVQITGYPGIDNDNPRTCSAWVKATENSLNRVIMSWGRIAVDEGTGKKWIFRIGGDDYLSVGTFGAYTCGSTVIDNGWHHVAVTLQDEDGDSDIEVEDIRFFVDGQPDPIGYTLNPQTKITTESDGDVLLGSQNVDGQINTYFDGLMDDVRIYSRVLSQDEITILSTDVHFDTIQDAVDAASFRMKWENDIVDTVEVKEGIYEENIKFRGVDVKVKSEDLLPDTVTIEGDGFRPVITFGGNETNESELTGFTITSESETPSVTGPVAHWKLDETDGSEAADSSINNHDGELKNMEETDWVNGNVGGALEFDGSNEYVEMPNYEGITGTAARTCSAWIKTSSTPGDILTWGELADGKKWLFGIYNDKLCVLVQGGRVFGSTIMTDGQWHHVVATLKDNGATTNVTDVKLYVDGYKEAITSPAEMIIETGDVDDVRIGVYYQDENYFAGLVDDVRIYDRALGYEEIEGLYLFAGGGICGRGTQATISKCVVTNNTAEYGGGINACNGQIDDCLVIDNHANYDAGAVHDCDGDIVNCTIVNNSATLTAGGLKDCNGTITNSIVWGNGDDLLNCSATTFCCIEDGDDAGTNGNIDDDPLFVDENMMDIDGVDNIFGTMDDGLQLKRSSPCRDTGDNTIVDSLIITTDIRGSARKYDSDHDDIETADMGAYEKKNIWYVNTNVSGGDGSGTSWENAFSELRDALDTEPVDPTPIEVYGGEIWVAQGTYKPTDDTDTSESFVMLDDMALYGGFAGSESNREERNPGPAPSGNETILSGDIGTSAAGYSENVVKSGSKNRVDGFTVEKGRRGIYCYGATKSVTIVGCLIRQHGMDGDSLGMGCGITATYGQICVENCVINENIYAGIYANTTKEVDVFGSDILDNGQMGIYMAYPKGCCVRNCVVANNNADTSPSAYFSRGISISQPESGYDHEIINCTIVGHVDSQGHGIYGSSAIDVRNCIVWDNQPWQLGGGVTTTHSCIEGGYTGLGNIDIVPVFDDSDYHLSSTSICIDAGEPWADYSNEPSPNGSRINMGAYGNTAEAATTTDIDDDGISDNWELYYWPEPEEPSSHDPSDNDDGDHRTNLAEFLYGYDPVDPQADSDTEPVIVHCTQSTTSGVEPLSFDPTKGETVDVNFWATWDLDVSSYVEFKNDTTETVTLDVQNISPLGNQIIWDGKDTQDEEIVKKADYSVTVKISYDPDPENTYDTENLSDVALNYVHEVTGLNCNPDRIIATYNEVTNITYEANTSTDMVIEIFRPGEEQIPFREFYILKDDPPGILWNGTADDGRYPFESGMYKVKVKFAGMREDREEEMAVYN